MRKKLLSALLGTTMVVSMLAGCGSSAETSTTQTTVDQKETTAAATEAASTEAASTEAVAAESTGTGKVYYLNFKPEQADDWKNLAAKYTEETGVQVGIAAALADVFRVAEMGAVRGHDGLLLIGLARRLAKRPERP